MPEPSNADDAMRIRDEIERRLGTDSAVAMIDVGMVAGGPAIRVHVRSPEDAIRLRRAGLPASVGGVAVVLEVADYGLEEPPG